MGWLFGKKKTESQVVVDTKMTELIIFLMSEYLKKCQGDIVLVSEKPELQDELKRLKKLGLENSENAKLLTTKITEIENKKERCEFGKGVVDFIKSMSVEFPGSYLISFDQFFGIIQKYKLFCKPIGKYRGIIPSENIKEIEVIKDKLLNWSDYCDPKLPINFCDSNISRNRRFWYINTINYYSGGRKDIAESLEDFIEKHGSIIGTDHDTSYSSTSFHLNRSEIKDIKFNSWLNNYDIPGDREDYGFKIEKLNYTDLLIAAPKNCFAEEYKVKEVPVDPIVFQYSPFGVIVHSVWGEEADDKVLTKYRELNKIILG